jgi:hypothetical protein
LLGLLATLLHPSLVPDVGNEFLVVFVATVRGLELPPEVVLARLGGPKSRLKVRDAVGGRE